MRIATWNVWHRFGAWELRGHAIAQTLDRVDADVLCLQEAWTELETGRSQAAELGARLGLPHHVDAHRVAHEGVTFGNAIVSRWPIEDHEWRPLTPHPDYEEHRTVLAARIAAPGGGLHVLTTHLNFMADQSAVRQAQVRDVARLAVDWSRRDPAYPAIVTGDLNAAPRSDEIRMLTGLADLGQPIWFMDAWEVAGDRSSGETWTSRNPLTADAHEPDRRIDYVLVGPPKPHGGRGMPQSCVRFGDAPVDGVWPSDHLGVCADLRT